MGNSVNIEECRLLGCGAVWECTVKTSPTSVNIVLKKLDVRALTISSGSGYDPLPPVLGKTTMKLRIS
jgi:hypothetical protein